MIGMRSGMGTKYGADVADPGAVGTPRKEPRPRKRKRKIPVNIKGLKVKKRR